MTRFGNNLFDISKIAAILQNEKDGSKILVILDNGRGISMEGDEAIQIWRHFDTENDWREDQGTGGV